MSILEQLLPAEHAASHVLVLPEVASAALPGLAGAWFADAGWEREPAQESRTRRTVGARFRGSAPAEVEVAPGRLRLGAEHRADGPFAVPAEHAAELGLPGPAQAWALGRADGGQDARGPRPSTYDDRDGIVRAFAAGLPVDEELRVVQWAVAVARREGGVVLADGRTRLAPDPASAVDLSLFSRQALSAADLLAVLRSLVATADVESQEATPDGAGRCRLVGPTPYDGALVVTAERAERVPRSLAALDPGRYGPFAYHLAWWPQDPYELQVEQPSGVHVIARARMRAMVARLALLVQGRAGGVLVDDGGFVASVVDVERRTDERTGGHAWV
jgi:hypothetical protein